MLAIVEPLTLSTKPMIRVVSSPARGPSGAKKLKIKRLEIAVDAQALQHREAEGEQRHDREHGGVDEAHRAQAELAREQVAQQRVGVARDREPARRRVVDRPMMPPKPLLEALGYELHARSPRSRAAFTAAFRPRAGARPRSTSRACAPRRRVGKRRARRGLVPIQRLEVIAYVLLIEAGRRSTDLVRVRRPEARGIRRQQLVHHA